MGLGGVRFRQRHGHVEVGGACIECPTKDRHHEPRVGRVQDMGASVGTDTGGHLVPIRCIKSHADEPWITGGFGGRAGAGCVEVG